MALKKAIISVMLSALLIGSTAIPIYAVEDTTNNTDSEEVLLEEEDEDTDNTDDTEDTDDTDTIEDTENTDTTDDTEDTDDIDTTEDTEDTDTTDTEHQDEKGTTDANTDDKTETDSGDKADSAEEEIDSIDKTEDTNKEDTTDEILEWNSNVKINCSIDFGFPRISNNNMFMHVDLSNVKITLLKADRKTVIKRFDMSKILQTSDNVSGFNIVDVELPSWKEGDKYVIRAENLPDIYAESVQELEITYCKVYDKDLEAWVIDGINRNIDVKFKTREANIALFIYDKNLNEASGVEFNYSILNSDDKVIYKGNSRTGDSGCGFFNIKLGYEYIGQNLKLCVDILNAFNGSVVTNEKTFDYMYMGDSLSFFSIEADGTTAEMNKDENGTKEVGTSDILVDINYSSKNDMLLFKNTNVELQVFSDNDLYETLTLSNDKRNDTLYGISNGVYTVIARAVDYDTVVTPTTLHVSRDNNVSMTATPKLALKIINEVDGKKYNAHFKVIGYNNEFNEVEHNFSVNAHESYKIVNLDNDTEYDVYINEYRETVLNIADGEISTYNYEGKDNGSINDNTNNTSGTDTGTNYNNDTINYVPKTGDIVFSIIMILIGITGLSYLGYLYFKRRGKKANEIKK